MKLSHAWRALYAVVNREATHFVSQTGRLLSAVVRPALWLLVFAAGFRSALSVSSMPPYNVHVEYQAYVVPGLLGMVLLFNGMQSSLAMVYDREMGMMRLLLTAPLPRWYLLLCKLAAGAALSLGQAYTFLVVTKLAGIGIPLSGWVTALPALTAVALMLGAFGLLLSIGIRQLENFAATMNFVIFPVFFLSSALYPLSRLEDSRAGIVVWLAKANPFTYGVELIRFALYGEFDMVAGGVVAASAVAFFLAAILGYDPQRGLIRRTAQAP